MRTTLEQIYGSQLELVRSELDQSHQVALTDLRDTLSKEHKEDMNRLEQDWSARLEDLKQDYDREMREARRDNTYSKLFFLELTLCMLGNFSCSCCRLLTFFQNCPF